MKLLSVAVAATGLLGLMACGPKKKERPVLSGALETHSREAMEDTEVRNKALSASRRASAETPFLGKSDDGPEQFHDNKDERPSVTDDSGASYAYLVGESEPAKLDPYKVEFNIPAEYNGSNSLNTMATKVSLKVYPGAKKQKFIITNLSDEPFRLHTGGAPCSHAPGTGVINKGESFTCLVTRTLALNPNSSHSPLYDHNNGNATSLFVEAVAAPDPLEVP